MTEVYNAQSQSTVLTPLVSPRDHAEGLVTAAITLVEYGDYHDPRCVAAQPWIKALQVQMGDRLCLVFRHFPEASLHPHAAEAAEAAGLQGQFWGMHATLLEHPSALGNGYLVEYAQGLGLDTDRFLRDMAGHACARRVRADRAGGTLSGVQGTPTFFVNGDRQPGARETEGAGTSSSASLAPPWAREVADRFRDLSEEPL